MRSEFYPKGTERTRLSAGLLYLGGRGGWMEECESGQRSRKSGVGLKGRGRRYARSRRLLSLVLAAARWKTISGWKTRAGNGHDVCARGFFLFPFSVFRTSGVDDCRGVTRRRVDETWAWRDADRTNQLIALRPPPPPPPRRLSVWGEACAIGEPWSRYPRAREVFSTADTRNTSSGLYSV